MARSLSQMMLKRFAAYPLARSSAITSRSIYQGEVRYSTTVPSDPDTHEDFRPTSKLESSGLSLENIVEQDVKENPVMIYMKGVPEFPQCGFSSLAVRVLKSYNAPISARNILEDPELKNAVKAFSECILKSIKWVSQNLYICFPSYELALSPFRSPFYFFLSVASAICIKELWPKTF